MTAEHTPHSIRQALAVVAEPDTPEERDVAWDFIVRRFSNLEEQLQALQRDDSADYGYKARFEIVREQLVGMREQYQALRDLIDGAGWAFDDERLGYIEIQVDRDAFIALRPDAFPAKERQ